MPDKKQPNALAEYSGLGFQLIVVLLGGYFLGDYLDKKFLDAKPVLSITFMILGLVASLVQIIRKLIRGAE